MPAQPVETHIAHEPNQFRFAERGADVAVLLHPDYQYDPTLVPQIVRPIVEGTADVVLGSRLAGGSVVAQGMPWWKYVSNRFLTWVENRAFGLDLSEYHTGYRAFAREVLETLQGHFKHKCLEPIRLNTRLAEAPELADHEGRRLLERDEGDAQRAGGLPWRLPPRVHVPMVRRKRRTMALPLGGLPLRGSARHTHEG